MNNGLSQKLHVELKNPSDAYFDTVKALFKEMGKKNPPRWALSFDIHFKGISAGYLTDPGAFPLDEARQMMVDMFTR